MLELVSETPPEIAFLLGFFVAQGLKRSRVSELVGLWLPSQQDPQFGTPAKSREQNKN